MVAPEEAYPPETKFVDHGNFKHPDTLVFRNACGLCPVQTWDGLTDDELEEWYEGIPTIDVDQEEGDE